MILTVGANGLLGTAAVEQLRVRGLPVRCLVRRGSESSQLDQLGAELTVGDVRDSASITDALNGVHTVISSFATNLAEDRSVANLWKNDYEGNLNLIRCAQQAGVKKFIFVSYWGLAKFGDFEHGKIKKAVEDLLSVSGLDYTVFRVTTLATDMSLLLGRRLKNKGRAPVLMKRREKIRPILLEDLAWCMADAISNPRAFCRTIEVAGREEYTFLELQDLFSRTIGRPVRFVFIPLPVANSIAAFVDFFSGNRYNARGLVSAFTGGSTCDISDMTDVFRLKQGSFARHLEDYFSTGSVIPQQPLPTG